jgi:hypothetical protein
MFFSLYCIVQIFILALFLFVVFIQFITGTLYLFCDVVQGIVVSLHATNLDVVS